MKGQLNLSDVMIMIFSIVLVIVVFVLGANVVLDTSAKATGKSNVSYRVSVVSEKMLNSPCTTVGRGVFVENRFKSGDFGCLNISGAYVHFAETSENQGKTGDYYFELKREESVPEVDAVTKTSYEGETRFSNGSVRGASIKTPATFFSRQTGKYYQGWMEMVIR